MSRASGEYGEILYTVEIGGTEHLRGKDVGWHPVSHCGLRFDYTSKSHRRVADRAEKKVACEVCRRIAGWDGPEGES